MEFRKGIRGYEACVSQIRCQKTNLKIRQHILRVIQHYSSRNIGTTQLENAEKLKLKYHKHNNKPRSLKNCVLSP
jgi:hypothetical protein